MEWVETTGETIEEARRHALDALGVPFDDAEIEVLEEAKSSMFGLRKTDARVRARVKPVQPRAKAERRDRSRRKSGSDRGARSDDGDAKKSGDRSNRGGQGRKGGRSGGNGGRSASGERSAQQRPRTNDDKPATPARQAKSGADAPTKEQAPMNENGNEEIMDAAGQAAVVEEFLDGLLVAFGAEGDLESVALDDETYEVRAHGGELGLLIGPKGSTMQAVQEIARTAVQQTADGQLTGRVHIDIGGYRNKRRAALAEFAVRLAETVRETGERKVLEPMPATDRKVIHDAVADVDGVISTSEGYDNERHIVLAPSD